MPTKKPSAPVVDLIATAEIAFETQRCHEVLFWSSYFIVASLLVITQFWALPVLIQMALYTAPIIYVGSHLSLQQKEINPLTGEKNMKTEAMTKHDAMLFPFIGSIALLALYFAYNFLPAYWVNLLLTTYLTFFGCAALGETLYNPLAKLFPRSSEELWLKVNYVLPTVLGQWIGPIEFEGCKARIISYALGAASGVAWTVTRHWVLHNLFAISFCVQGIRIVSVGSFKIATILLCGLFVYDVFWVFGTNVMVTVAKSFEAPAKIIFPISYNPWRQSILGLGDIVIPGIFIAMVLRFDHHFSSVEQHKLQKASKKMNHASEDTSSKAEHNESDDVYRPPVGPINIHQHFRKFFFICNLVAYEAGLLTTGLVMIIFQHAQPALLYLVPFCLLGLFIPAWITGTFNDVYTYTEEELNAPTADDTCDKPTVESTKEKEAEALDHSGDTRYTKKNN